MGSARISTRGYHPKIFIMKEAEERNTLIREEREHMENQKKLEANYWACREAIAIGVLKEIDAFGWEAWYDNDRNVPAKGTRKSRALLIEDRVRALAGSFPVITSTLHNGVYIWADSMGAFIFSKVDGALQWLEFDNTNDAMKFIEVLIQQDARKRSDRFTNIGFGVVLDIMPTALPRTIQNAGVTS